MRLILHRFILHMELEQIKCGKNLRNATLPNPPRTISRTGATGTGKSSDNKRSRATTILKAMSNSQRLKIISHLMDGEEHSVKSWNNMLNHLASRHCRNIWVDYAVPRLLKPARIHKRYFIPSMTKPFVILFLFCQKNIKMIPCSNQ